jgi:hypothetical protein
MCSALPAYKSFKLANENMEDPAGATRWDIQPIHHYVTVMGIGWLESPP